MTKENCELQTLRRMLKKKKKDIKNAENDEIKI